MLGRICGVVVAVAVLLGAPSAHAMVLPDGFVAQPLVTGLDGPVEVAFTPDGRMLIAEKQGVVQMAKQGADGVWRLNATPVLDIRSQVNEHLDRGLLGLASDTAGGKTRIFVLFTRDNNDPAPDEDGPQASRLDRYELSGDVAVVSSKKTLLGKTSQNPCVNPPSNTVDCLPSDSGSHSIGTIRIDPRDGTLWVGTGDGANWMGADPLAYRSWDTNSLAGSIMHVEPENGNGLAGHPFCPSETDLTKNCTKLAAKGFRNPFRFTLPPGGGTPIVGDVGYFRYEELNKIELGKNYGWPCYEGADQALVESDPTYQGRRTPDYNVQEFCTSRYGTPGLATPPDHEHPHPPGTNGGSVIGGAFVPSDSNWPSSMRGRLLFGDYTQGWLRLIDIGSDGHPVAGALQDFVPRPADDDPEKYAKGWYGVAVEQLPGTGDLLSVDFGFDGPGSGSITRFRYSPANRPPVAIAQSDANPDSLTVNFDSTLSSDPDREPITYAWEFGDGATSTQANPQHTYASPGRKTVRLTVRDAGGLTGTTTIEISPGNAAPSVTFTGPADESTYRAGEPVQLSGSATDLEDGPLDGSKLRWDVVLHHNVHQHQFATLSGSAPSFTPERGHSTDSYYEITLTATDSRGVRSTPVTRQIRHEPSTLRLRSSPSGVTLSWSGATHTTPKDVVEGIGYTSTLSAPATYASGGCTRDFSSWSQGGERVQQYTVAAGSPTLTASYANPAPTAQAAADTSGGTLDVRFSSAGSADPHGDALTYRWDFGDGTTSTQANPTHRYANTTQRTATLTVTDPCGATATDTVTVNPQNGRPTASITSPPNDTATYRAGTAFTFTGSGTDPEGGSVTLQWTIERVVTATNARTTVATPTGTSATFTPSSAYTDDVHYEATLVATDPLGSGSAPVRRTIRPETSTLKLRSQPTGAPITWDGATGSAPRDETEGVGYEGTLEAAASFESGGHTYAFESWSHGGARLQTYAVAPGSPTLTARYNGLPVAKASYSDSGSLNVPFSSAGTSDPDSDPLTYQWDFGDGSTSTQANPTHRYADATPRTVTLTVRDGRGGSDTDTITVDPSNAAPSATITSPPDGSTFRAGSAVTLAGSANDPEDGEISGDGLRWRIERNGPGTARAVVGEPLGGSVAFTPSRAFSLDVEYVARLEAIDALGRASAPATVTLRPKRVVVRLRSVPTGIGLTWAGVVRTTPHDRPEAAGFRATIAAPARVTAGGRTYEFVRWSDGAPRSHAVDVPDGGTTLTATFRDVTAPPKDDVTDPPPDRAAPVVRFAGVGKGRAKRSKLTGTAADPSGVARVEVALRARKGKAGCRWWSRSRKRFAKRSTSCRRPKWIRAQLGKGDPRPWSVELGRSLHRGSYVLEVRARDAKGNVATRFAGGRARQSIRVR